LCVATCHAFSDKLLVKKKTQTLVIIVKYFANSGKSLTQDQCIYVFLCAVNSFSTKWC